LRAQNRQKIVDRSAANALIAALGFKSSHFGRKIIDERVLRLSQKLSVPATTVSLNRLAVATMRSYPPARTGKKRKP
jgi:hypothetical protein